MATKSYAGQAVEPQARASQDWLPGSIRASRPRFLLLIHPEHWDWSERAGEWLPSLLRMALDPGVGGVGHGPDGKGIDDSDARMSKLQKGHIILENGDPRLADVLPGGIYLQRWKAAGTQPGRQGWAYGYAWESPRRVAKDDIRWAFDEDLEIRVRKHLISLVGDLSPELVERDVERARQRWDRYAQKRTPGTSPTLREEQAEARWRRMSAALSRLTGQVGAAIAPDVPTQAPDPEVEDEPVITSPAARAAKPAKVPRKRKAEQAEEATHG